MLRMANAERLLDNPGLSVAEVARMVGYGDPRHFSRQFRRETGKSPTHYRRARLIPV